MVQDLLTLRSRRGTGIEFQPLGFQARKNMFKSIGAIDWDNGSHQLPKAIGNMKFAGMATRSEPRRRQPTARRASNFIRALAVGIAATPVAFAQDSVKEYAPKTGPTKNFIMHEAPEPGVALNFEDGEAHPRSLADFRGKIVLLNVWATWCAPCVREIPALDRLVAALSDADVAVVAVSIDRKGIDAVRKAFVGLDVQRLAPYVDRSGQALRSLRAMGLPTSLLIDREGRELGRVVGPAAWDDAAMIAFFRQAGSPEARSERQSDRAGPGPGR